MIEQLYQKYQEYSTICTDTRAIMEGSIFFALRGENFNGNLYALEALTKGCSFAVIDEEIESNDDRLVKVENVLQTLQGLAQYHRKQLNIPVIGITGSNGKTTTKELLHAILSTQFNCFATKGNFNNHIGVPLSLLAITSEAEIAVIEMGANHYGEIGELCKICLPGYGIITNIGKAHLEGFGGIEGVIRAKRQLYDHIREHGGKLFVHADNDLLMELSEGIERTTYGTITNADHRGEHVEGDFYAKFNYFSEGEKIPFSTNLVGQYNAENAMAALCIGLYFGISLENAQKALGAYQPSNNRSQLVKSAKNSIIMDAYNANPVSMSSAVTNLGQVKSNKKVLILGDMFELGEHSKEEHQKIVDLALELQLENVLLVGKAFAQTKSNYLKFENAAEVRKHLEKHPISDASVLVKGSRGMKLESIVDLL